MVVIDIVDNGCERYRVNASSLILGRMWDNNAESIVVNRPERENWHALTMIVTKDGVVKDHIAVTGEPILVSSLLSQYPSVEIGFSFSGENGYIKNSEIKEFFFLMAQRPDGFIAAPPEQSGNIDVVIGKAFVDVGWKEGGRNTLEFKNQFGEAVKQIELSGFVQEQADLGEQDSTKESFVQGKKTSNLENDGDGTSPFATEEFVLNNQGGGTGAGGTTDYNALENKPSINGVTLEGNKTTEDLGIVSKESDPTVPDHVKAITEQDIEGWNNKVDKFISESSYEYAYMVIPKTQTPVHRVVNYSDLAQSIPIRSGSTLNFEVGTPIKDKECANKKYTDEKDAEIRAVAEGKTKSFTIATLTDLGTLLGIDTSVVTDEYTITSTTITYKEQSIELKQGDLFLIVDTSVPDYWVSVDDMKIYKMETTKVDLTDYVKNTDIADSSTAGVVKVNANAGYGVGILESGVLRTVSANNSQISSKASNYMPIVPATLDYAVKKALADCKLEGDNAWTNEEKTLAVNLLGAVKQVEYSKTQTIEDGSDAGVIGRAYIRDRQNNENTIVLNCQNAKFTIPVRDATGNFYVGNPTQAYHTTNKLYVDNIAKTIPSITATQLEDGSYSLSITTPTEA